MSITQLSEDLQAARKVHFSDHVSVVKCDTLKNFDPTEIWYREDEIESFKDNARFLSKVLKQAKKGSDEGAGLNTLNLTFIFGDDCFERGLEQRIDELRTIRRLRAMRSIVRFQNKCGGNNMSLSFVSLRLSKCARLEAYNTGLRDAREASEVKQIVSVHEPIHPVSSHTKVNESNLRTPDKRLRISRTSFSCVEREFEVSLSHASKRCRR